MASMAVGAFACLFTIARIKLIQTASTSNEVQGTHHQENGSRLVAGSRLVFKGTETNVTSYLARLALAEESPRVTSQRSDEWNTSVQIHFREPKENDTSHISGSAGKRIDSSGAVLIPTKRGWIKIARTGDRQWAIERNHLERIDIDRALIQLLGTTSNVLPLHASVANLHATGIATIGSSSGGKTTVLLSLLELGASWISDDVASYYRDTNEIVARPTAIDAKWRYLRDVDQLRREVAWEDQLRLRFHPAVRRIAGMMSEFRLPNRISQKLQRVGQGESRIRITPPNWRPSTKLDVVILAGESEQAGIREIDRQSAAYPIARLLYDEVKSIAEINEEVLATGAAPMLDPWAEHEKQIYELTSQMLLNKKIYVLSKPAITSMQHIKELLSPIAQEATRLESTPMQYCLSGV